MTVTLGPPASSADFQSDRETPAGTIFHQPGSRLRFGQDFSEVRKVVLDAVGLAAFEAEFAIVIRMDEIVAGFIHHIDLRVSNHAVANATDCRAQIDGDNHNSEPPAVGGDDRGGGSKGRNRAAFR